MKKTLTIAALGVAFVAVSLWVWLSRGKHAGAVRAKFRLGGAIIAITSIMNLASCDGEPSLGVDCYDPAPANEIYLTDYRYNDYEVRNGDVLNFECYALFEQQIIVAIESAEGEELQRTSYNAEESQFTFTHTVEVGTYTGKAFVRILLASENVEPYESRTFPITIVE